jgi:hypothetical protein
MTKKPTVLDAMPKASKTDAVKPKRQKRKQAQAKEIIAKSGVKQTGTLRQKGHP